MVQSHSSRFPPRITWIVGQSRLPSSIRAKTNRRRRRPIPSLISDASGEEGRSGWTASTPPTILLPPRISSTFSRDRNDEWLLFRGRLRGRQRVVGRSRFLLLGSAPFRRGISLFAGAIALCVLDSVSLSLSLAGSRLPRSLNVHSRSFSGATPPFVRLWPATLDTAEPGRIQADDSMATSLHCEAGEAKEGGREFTLAGRPLSHFAASGCPAAERSSPSRPASRRGGRIGDALFVEQICVEFRPILLAAARATARLAGSGGA